MWWKKKHIIFLILKRYSTVYNTDSVFSYMFVGNVASVKASGVAIPESVSLLRCILFIKCDSGNSALAK